MEAVERRTGGGRVCGGARRSNHRQGAGRAPGRREELDRRATQTVAGKAETLSRQDYAQAVGLTPLLAIAEQLKDNSAVRPH